MIATLRTLPIAERIQLVQDLWDSIAEEQATLSLTQEQKRELDRRLDAYELEHDEGHPADQVIAEVRRKL